MPSAVAVLVLLLLLLHIVLYVTMYVVVNQEPAQARAIPFLECLLFSLRGHPIPSFKTPLNGLKA